MAHHITAVPETVVRGVVTAIGQDDAEGGCYVRLRVTEDDAAALARAGAFGRILRLTLPSETAPPEGT